jgi:ketosteroid isomerase-like protein
VSEENVEIVRQIYAHWTRGDFRSGVNVFDPDIEFEIDGSVNPSGGIRVRGVAEMSKVWRETLSGWADFRVGEIIRLIETNNDVIAINRLQGRGPRSGIVVDQADRAGIFTFRDGRISRLRLTTATAALKTAGLSE